MNALTAMRQYKSVNTQVQALDATPHQLIQMLLEGGLMRVAQARGAMERSDLAKKGELIGQAISIIGGLREGLNLEQGGEIASNLDNLYEYMTMRLLDANVHNDIVPLEEVSLLLRNVKSSWDAIAQV
jgi:flagellar protein FliS